MHRFFIDPQKISNGEVHFPNEIAHQILHVLRLGESDHVLVFDNMGDIHLVSLCESTHKTLIGKIIKTENVRIEEKTTIALYFGMTSREKVEWILQKGTEVGASTFQPFISSRSLVQSKDLSDKKFRRWGNIVREAAEQSGRSFLPVLNLALDYESAVGRACDDHDLCLLAWEKPVDDRQHLARALSRFNNGKIALLVGPEGGFSDDEVCFAKEKGCQIVSLGEGILRMETAAIVFPALVLYELNRKYP